MPGERVDRRHLLRLTGSATAATLAGCTRWIGDTDSAVGGTIEVNPADALVDEPLEIVLSEAEPNEQLTVWARTDDDHGQTWLSFGHYETDTNGALDLADHSPISGTYERNDPNGLLWSLRVPDGPEVPFLEGDAHEIEFIVQRDDTTIATTEITRRFVDPGVSQHPVDEDGISGIFFDPADSDPHSGVLVLHCSEGAIPWLYGAMLASRGYATLALQYFSPIGEDGLPEELVGVPLEYCKQALDWLLDQPAVAGDQIGVVGASKGGELALLLGATYPAIGAVVGYVPSGVVWEGLSFEGEVGSSWSYEGQDVPYVPIEFDADAESLGAMVDGIRGQPVSLTSSYRTPLDLPADDRVVEATIPVERIDGPVVLISGTEDALWPSTELSEIAMHRLEEHDHAYPSAHLVYEGAGHLINIPYQPTTHFDAFEFMPGFTMAMGGTPADNARAAADSWPRVLGVLEEGLR